MNKTITGIIVALIIIVGGYFLLSNDSAPTGVNSNNIISNTESTSDQSTEQSVTTSIPATKPAPANVTVTYTDSGFDPKNVTIKLGDSVTWVNKSTHEMWIGSAFHPTHEAYAGTSLSEHCDDSVDVSFDQCKTGDSYTFTFNKAGQWFYHNHVGATDSGSVTVQ